MSAEENYPTLWSEKDLERITQIQATEKAVHEGKEKKTIHCISVSILHWMSPFYPPLSNPLHFSPVSSMPWKVDHNAYLLFGFLLETSAKVERKKEE